MKVKYDSNNSGGRWWLDDKDWYSLEKAGWKINWVKNEPVGAFHDEDDRWLGALASSAEIEIGTIKEAIESFEKATGQDVSNEGCNCCGPPHCFDWEDKYASGEELLGYMFPKKKANKTKRQLLENGD